MKKILFLVLILCSISLNATTHLFTDRLDNVRITDPITDEPFIFDAATGNWINGDKIILEIRQSGVITPYNNILTINVDDTKFDIAEMTIAFVDKSDADPANHIKQIKTFATQTAVTATYLTSNVGTWLGYNSAGTVIQSPTEFTPEQRNSIVQIGRLGHFGKTVITGTFDLVWLCEMSHNWGIEKASTGPVRLSGAIITANGANLKWDRSIGNFLRVGGGSTRNAINYPQTPAAVQVSGIPAYNSASGEGILEAATTDIDPLHYDDRSGTLADITAGQYANIFVYHFPYKSTVTTMLIYGDREYSSLNNAIQGVRNEEYNIPSDITNGVILVGFSVLKETTNLTTAITGGTAAITKIPKRGSGVGGIGVGLWDKTGDDLSPATPGDNIKLATGNIQLGDATIEHGNTTHDIIYGSELTGLNDVIPSGTYTELGNALFDLEIDGIGSPNTFRWRIDGGAWTSNVNMTGSAQLLQDGISVTWGSIIGHTNNDYWYLNVGYEVHITDPLHVLDDGTFDGDVTVGGVLKTNSPVRIQEGIEILCDETTDKAKFSTSCTAIDFAINDTTRLTLESDGTIVAATTNYETLVTSDNDIPNKKYVDDFGIDNGETGWVSGGVLTKTIPNSDSVIISTEMIIKVIDRTNRTIKYATISAGTTIPTGMSPNELKYVFVDINGGTPTYKWIVSPTGADRRKYAQFGRVWMDAVGNVSGIGDYVDPAWDAGESFKETMFLSSICRVSSGNTYSLHGTNMTMQKTSGSDFRMAAYAKEYIAGTNDSPNEGTESAVSEFTDIIMMRRDSPDLNHISAIPTTQYELDGVLTDLGVNKYGYILVFHSVKSNLCLLQHGDTEYGSLQAAIDGFDANEYTFSPVVKNACICKGLIAFKKGVSSPTSADIEFISLNFVPGIGTGGAGGGGITNIIEDITPQFGGDLDVNGKKITSASNGNIEITPNGTGNVGIGTSTPNSLLDIEEDTAGTNAVLTLMHTDNTSTSSGAYLNLVTVDPTGGNPFMAFSIANVCDWGMGVDNADSDKFKIGTTADISANNVITLDRSGAMGLGTTTPYGNGLTISSNIAPHLYWYNSADTANNRLWDFLAYQEKMTFRAVNDANTLAENFLEVDRTEHVIDSVGFPNGNVNISEYTKLGSDAPAIKVKELNGTTASTEGGNTTIAHGLTAGKMMPISIEVEFATDNTVHPEFTRTPGYQFHYQRDATNITVWNHVDNSENILSKPITILVTYEE